MTHAFQGLGKGPKHIGESQRNNAFRSTALGSRARPKEAEAPPGWQGHFLKQHILIEEEEPVQMSPWPPPDALLDLQHPLPVCHLPHPTVFSLSPITQAHITHPFILFIVYYATAFDEIQLLRSMQGSLLGFVSETEKSQCLEQLLGHGSCSVGAPWLNE